MVCQEGLKNTLKCFWGISVNHPCDDEFFPFEGNHFIFIQYLKQEARATARLGF